MLGRALSKTFSSRLLLPREAVKKSVAKEMQRNLQQSQNHQHKEEEEGLQLILELATQFRKTCLAKPQGQHRSCIARRHLGSPCDVSCVHGDDVCEHNSSVFDWRI